MPVCSQCNKECVFKEEKNELFGCPCDVCKEIWCKNCARMSASEIKCLSISKRVIMYFCSVCVEEIKKISEIKQRLLNVENKMDDVSQATLELSTLKETVKKIESKLLSLDCEIQKSTQSYAEITAGKQRIKNLEHKVELELASKLDLRSLEDTMKKTQELTPNTPHAITLEPTLTEMQERQQRANNVLLFGVPEISGSEKEVRVKEELTKITEVLGYCSEGSLEKIKFYRLGKYLESKVRPIKVTFPTREEAIHVIKNKRKIPEETKIYIKSDQTVLQREYLKKVVEQLESRRVNGETNIKIKYINHIPKIISFKNPKNE